MHREDQDLGAGIRVHYFRRSFETAHNRHRYVHHNRVGSEFLAEPDRFLSVCCLSHDFPILHLQNSADTSPHNSVIINKQNAWNCPIPLNESSERNVGLRCAAATLRNQAVPPDTWVYKGQR